MNDQKINKSNRPTALLIGIQRPQTTDEEHQSSLDELSRLVETLGYEVVGRTSQKRTSLLAGTAVGAGKLKEIAKWTGGSGVAAGFVKHTSHQAVNQNDGDLADEVELEEPETFGTEGAQSVQAQFVIFDVELTPTQSKNLEEALGVDVMDRTGVIVEIFHRHARTPAAKAQVEIARLTYLTPRIRATGGGDRQGGGIGAKGAGETQHELDRRRIRDRIAELKAEIEEIHRDESLRRQRRRDSMKLALVGYTNAGKSSLMRALTGSEVLVADKLFATLDTTVRAMVPETKPKILVSDTVGFIKKLPHDLVASFRSTLDEALDASLLLFVVDASDPSFRSQLETTKEVLGDIGADDRDQLLILNKCDKLSEETKRSLKCEYPSAVFLSTRDPQSVQSLKQRCIDYFETTMTDDEFEVPYANGSVVAEIHRTLRVLGEEFTDDGTKLKVRGFSADLERVRKLLQGES